MALILQTLFILYLAIGALIGGGYVYANKYSMSRAKRYVIGLAVGAVWPFVAIYEVVSAIAAERRLRRGARRKRDE